MPVLLSNTSGKLSPSIDEELCARVTAKRPKSFLVVVPTKRRVRELQRRLIHCAPHAVIPLTNLFTLSLLAKRLYLSACAPKRAVQGPVQAVIVEEAIKHLSGDLRYFLPRGSGRLPHGTFRKIIEVINNMKEKGLYHEQFERELEIAETDERAKLVDISHIYSEYERRLAMYGLTDAAGVLKELNEAFTPGTAGTVVHTAFPDIDTVFVEGFSELAPPELRMLETFASVPGLAMVLLFDYSEENPEIFGNLQDEVETFRSRGFRRSTAAPKPDSDFRSFIARHLFDPRGVSRKYDAREIVAIVEAPDRRMEAEILARIVKRYLLDHPGSDPSKICVATYDTAKYTGHFREIFRSYGVPVNITDRFQLASSPVVVSILAMLDIVRNNFRQKDVLRALASPYCSLARTIAGSPAVIDAANLYTTAKRLKITAGRATWRRNIVSRTQLLQSQLEDAEEALEKDDIEKEIERLRKAGDDITGLEEILSPFESPMTPSEFKNRLLQLLNRMQVGSMILNGDRGRLPDTQRELETRALAKFLNLIDDVLELLEFQERGKQKESLAFYLDQMKTAVGQVRFNVRQRQGYGVYVTSVEETRGLEFDVMLIGGLIDGEFPAIYQPEIFLSKFRRRTEERHAREYRNLFYQGITNFSKQLYLTYPRKDGDTELVQSVFVDAIDKIADVRKWSRPEVQQLLDAVFSETDLHSAYGTGRRETGNLSGPQASTHSEATLRHINHGIEVEQSRTGLHTLPEFEGNIGAVLGADKRNALEAMRKRVFSVSQLEMYGKCPFQYFADRILRLNVIEKIEEELTPIERGSVLHEILFEFSISRRQAGKPPLAQCSDGEAGDALRELQEIARKKLDELLISDAFWDFEKETILGYGTRRSGIIRDYITSEQSSTLTTAPAFFEVGFGGLTGARRKTDPELSHPKPIKFGDVAMRGKIDRIEIGPSEFCIVDYKTGSRTAKRKEIDEGTSLQLPIYLHAVEEMLREKTGRTLAPAGGVYYMLRPVKRELGLGNREFNKKAFNAGSNSGQLLDNETELRSVIESVIGTVNMYVDKMASGEFPLTTPEKIDTVCKYCSYSKICRIQTARHIGETAGEREK